MGVKQLVVDHLEDARGRTLALLEPIDDADLERQVSPLMSPLAWDLAHVAHYEELWLLRALTAARPTDARYDDLYDAFKHARRERADLPILNAEQAREFAGTVRAQVLESLEGISLDVDDPLRKEGFVYGMVVQHEHQHRETMLATINLMGEHAALTGEQAAEAPAATAEVRAPNDGHEIAVPGGTFVMGTDDEPWAYDNERPAHEVELAPFEIDAAPVTNAQYLAFVEDGGYHDARLWTAAGWAWRREAGLEHPQFWSREGSRSWSVLRFGRREPVVPHEPVQHVCWYEADAFARWAGKRLPSEAEWEYAASGAPDGHKRRYPWGDADPTPEQANLGQLRHGPAPIRTSGDGASAWGCRQMVGDVWEWTSSDFRGHPGFASHPYREYSEVFFGPEYKVLRGGSWATHPSACRTTFRNWDFPIRRQIFCGFRCARDA